ncbi:uncharacterized protein LOC141903586 [Tubulanus polymorphus]|uniref:uncharacterized protein LOC141903586 n=1 Tax=Tubulanus polymorphus TaxID=672921 RepID=UPI003DA6863E
MKMTTVGVVVVQTAQELQHIETKTSRISRRRRIVEKIKLVRKTDVVVTFFYALVSNLQTFGEIDEIKRIQRPPESAAAIAKLKYSRHFIKPLSIEESLKVVGDLDAINERMEGMATYQAPRPPIDYYQKPMQYQLPIVSINLNALRSRNELFMRRAEIAYGNARSQLRSNENFAGAQRVSGNVARSRQQRVKLWDGAKYRASPESRNTGPKRH